MRRILGVATLAVVALSIVLIGSASAAKPPASSGGCPNGNILNYPESGIVGADFTISGQTTTYKFISTDQSPTGGVPGLNGYCVYVGTAPETVQTTVTGFDGSTWKASKPGKSFGFTRPGGESSNIPLDGATVDPIGSATWATEVAVPTTQTILLHISGTAANMCNGLPTCYVRPTLEFGPICDAGSGNTDAAYNAIPTDVEHCSPPSFAFEGNFANEFGDEVLLDTTGGDGSGGVSLRVDFQSYGCGTAGHWYDPQCATTSGQTFTVPGGITAKIYDSSLTLIATSATIDPNIPFRPSAISDASCPNAPADPNALNSRFMDPVSGQCNYSLSVPLTFTFPNHTFTSGQDVVWTVQFNTSHGGYAPIVTNLPPEACIVNAQGCGYDSLNVGTKTYAPSAFAGTDVSEDTAFVSTGNPDFAPPLVPLAADTGWTGYRPLGEIVLIGT